MTRLYGIALLLVGLTCSLAVAACSSEGAAEEETAPNTLTEAEREEGWTLLFDGETFDGWTGLGRDEIPEGHWTIEDGTIRKVDSGEVPTAEDGQPLEGGDIMTEETYRDFELAFEWKTSEGGNSGIKYNVSESLSTEHDPPNAALGFEYQLLDDDRHPDAEEANHRAAALYDLIEANDRKELRPVGEWNEGRIVFDGNRGEHWLNGEKVVEYELGSARMDSLLEASKYADIDGFAERRTGRIVLQDHGDDFWLRSIKIRELPAEN